MSPVEQIRAVRALLTTDGAWLPGYRFGAVDRDNRWIDVRAAEAVRWSLLAAFCRVGGPLHERVCAVELLGRAAATMRIQDWEEQPGRTQAEVLAALDRAADLAIAERRP